MNYSGVDVTARSDTLSKDILFAESITPRQRARIERDRERGYSINIKQIVLAFAVEFVIIGLILTNNVATVAQLPDSSTFKTIQALLFPIAMAMVELARVPLAIAVRTQNSWNIKFAALVGVFCAVAVTSVSLILIGNSTFNPRLEDTHKKDDVLTGLKEKKKELLLQIQLADENVQQKRRDKEAADKSTQALIAQLNAQPPQNCNVITIPSPAPGAPATTSQVCRTNPVLKTLNAEITSAKTKLVELDAAVKEAEGKRGSQNFDPRPLDEAISNAEQENRGSIYQSQLHSYAAMLFQKAPQDVTDANVKTLEWYLIVIPSIAAAFSSTLIAMTAVRRIKRPALQTTAIPDEAAAYLFGPLVAAIRQEAQEAVRAATRDNPEKQASSRTS
jgi:hypothetical protein